MAGCEDHRKIFPQFDDFSIYIGSTQLRHYNVQYDDLNVIDIGPEKMECLPSITGQKYVVSPRAEYHGSKFPQCSVVFGD
jgi:hypothetical protein